jgi:orotidine-5'-phosphate decarboxylase
VLGVTVLTSLGTDQLRDELGLVRPPQEQVVFWAKLARDCGLAGAVASPQEIGLIRQQCGHDFLIVTPGIRPAGSGPDDQKRVSTPGEALRAGANYLVVGRPITRAPDPRQAALAIIEEMEAAIR